MFIKLILAVALVLLADAADAGQRILKKGPVTIRLSDAPCSTPAALVRIDPIYHARFRDGHAQGPDFSWPMCWTDIAADGEKMEGAIYMGADDGSSGPVDLSGYREDHGI